jgi:ribosome biogenesis GTPase
MTASDHKNPSSITDLHAWGWDEHWSGLYQGLGEPDLLPGRVVLEKRGFYRLIAANGDVAAGTTGRVRHVSEGAAELPAVGDWVLFRPAAPGQQRALITKVLPRKSRLSRKVAGTRADEQVVAANLDTVFVGMGLDGDFSLRRLERFLVVAWDSGAQPVVLLNKTDLVSDSLARRAQVLAIAGGAPVLLISCKKDEGLEGVGEHLQPGRTAVLLGSSGVGKSTLVNRLSGEDTQRTNAVREGDDRGRHTTTHRQLFRLPGGALLLDNPGVREIQPWQARAGLRAAFEDLHELAEDCRFRDCTHRDEPDCAVREAAETGDFDAERLDSFQSISDEQQQLERRKSEGPRGRSPRQRPTFQKKRRSRPR